MARPRKSIAQLSPNTLKKNTGKYKARIEEEKRLAAVPQPPKGPTDAPSYFKLGEVQAWSELLDTMPEHLRGRNNLLLEQAAKLLARSRTEQLKASEQSNLLKLFAALQSGSLTQSVPLPPPVEEKEIEDNDARYLREEAEDAEDERLDHADIAAELERRRSHPMPEGLTEAQHKFYLTHHQAALDIGVKVNLFDSEGNFSGTSSARYQQRLRERKSR